MMKSDTFSLESSSSISVPMRKSREQAKLKQNNHSVFISKVSPVTSSGKLKPSPRKAEFSQAESEAGATEETPTATVLFVSDDDYLRSTMRAYLEHVGFLVRSCADAARVPELFFRAPGAGSAVDLLLIDVQALGATGLLLAAELTCFEPDLPVVVIAAPGMDERDLGGITRRGWKMLNKPVLLPQLLGVIRSSLEPSRPAGPVVRAPLRN